MVNITVGTPAQNLSLSLDTGSSDIWVNVPNSTYCAADDNPCSSTGLFDPNNSSTFKLLDYEMNATYVSGFLAKGPYATDTLVIGGAMVKNMEFAVAEESLNPRKYNLLDTPLCKIHTKTRTHTQNGTWLTADILGIYRWYLGNRIRDGY